MIETDSFKIQKVRAFSLPSNSLEDFYPVAVELSPHSRVVYVGLIDNISKPNNERVPRIAVFGTKEFQLISKADLVNQNGPLSLCRPMTTSFESKDSAQTTNSVCWHSHALEICRFSESARKSHRRPEYVAARMWLNSRRLTRAQFGFRLETILQVGLDSRA